MTSFCFVKDGYSHCPYCRTKCHYRAIDTDSKKLVARYIFKCECDIIFHVEYDYDDNETCFVKALCYFCNANYFVPIATPLTQDEGNVIPCPECWDEYECDTWWDQMEGCIDYEKDYKNAEGTSNQIVACGNYNPD